MRARLARVALAGALALLLAGCETGPPLEVRLQPWVGRSEGDLVAAFGVPAATYVVGDRKFLQFAQRRTQVVASDPWFYRPYGRFGPLWQPSPGYILVGCDVTFSLRQGVVEAFSFRGEGCR